MASSAQSTEALDGLLMRIKWLSGHLGAPVPDDAPKWRRRKEARSGEIIDAALEAFAEKGFAAAKLDDIARRAGI
jgi:hypothetical protein